MFPPSIHPHNGFPISNLLHGVMENAGPKEGLNVLAKFNVLRKFNTWVVFICQVDYGCTTPLWNLGPPGLPLLMLW